MNRPTGKEEQGGVLMRRLLPKLVLLVIAAGMMSGCAAGLKQSMEEQNAAIAAMQARLEQVAQQDDMNTREITAMRRDMSQIGLKVTQAEEQVSELAKRTENVSTRVSLLNDEVSRIKSGEGAGLPTPGMVLQFVEGPAAATGNTKAVYDNALRLYYADKTRDAIAEFAKVLQMDPTSDLADNADYWTGECYYKLEEYPQALAAFQRVFNHKGSNKYEDAQLKIGMTYMNMGRKNEAIAAFRELLQKYPNSVHGEKAREYIARLGG